MTQKLLQLIKMLLRNLRIRTIKLALKALSFGVDGANITRLSKIANLTIMQCRAVSLTFTRHGSLPQPFLLVRVYIEI